MTMDFVDSFSNKVLIDLDRYDELLIAKRDLEELKDRISELRSLIIAEAVDDVNRLGDYYKTGTRSSINSGDVLKILSIPANTIERSERMQRALLNLTADKEEEEKKG